MSRKSLQVWSAIFHDGAGEKSSEPPRARASPAFGGPPVRLAICGVSIYFYSTGQVQLLAMAGRSVGG